MFANCSHEKVVVQQQASVNKQYTYQLFMLRWFQTSSLDRIFMQTMQKKKLLYFFEYLLSLLKYKNTVLSLKMRRSIKLRLVDKQTLF